MSSSANHEQNRTWLALQIIVPVILVVTGGALLLNLGVTASPHEIEIAAYATNLAQRTPRQRRNAVLAGNTLNNTTIPPGGVFSFNRKVGSWSQDRGYVDAPVSYDGELIMAPGGGVCQTSSTLYNAALLAGLTIVQRHHHDYTADYVPPGRDAAVAQYTIDLQIKNPYPWPVTLECHAEQNRLVASVLAPRRPPYQVHILTLVLEQTRPKRISRMVSESGPYGHYAYLRNPGMTGFRVQTYRIFTKNGKQISRQLLSDDTYKSMNALVQIDEPSVR